MEMEMKIQEEYADLIKKRKKTKDIMERGAKIFFTTAAVIAASFIVLIIVFIVQKGIAPFFDGVNFFSFITGTKWLDGPVGESYAYGIGFAIVNTLIVIFGAVALATPIGVLTALFIAKIAPKKIAAILRSMIELLAAIPSIIYGVFGIGLVTSLVMNFAGLFGIVTAGGLSVIATVIVLALMILPTITVMSENAIRSVNKNIEQGSLALGASQMQTYRKVILTSAKNGIFAGIILGVGRALGEATAVSMVSGNRFGGIAFLPFQTTATMTSRMLIGIKETTGIDYDIRFSVGLVLMIVIIFTNFILKLIMKKVGNLDG